MTLFTNVENRRYRISGLIINTNMPRKIYFSVNKRENSGVYGRYNIEGYIYNCVKS
jgi:hypothetical protein